MKNYETEIMNLNEQILTTPLINGTDEEKISTLAYWSDLIGLLRSINSSVISVGNRIAILQQFKKEVELVTLEVTNSTAHPSMNQDGSAEMKKDGDPEEDAPKVVDLATAEEIPPQPTDPTGVDASGRKPQNFNQYEAKNISVIEQNRRLAGIYGPRPVKQEKKIQPVAEEKVDPFAAPPMKTTDQLRKLAGIWTK